MANEIKWSHIPHSVHHLILSYLTVTNRVAVERVSSDFKKISDELFKKQKRIDLSSSTHYKYEPFSGIFPYFTLAIRCPKLEVFTFTDIQNRKKQKIRDAFDLLIDLFKLCPNIRIFEFVCVDTVNVVMFYLHQYRVSNMYVPGSISVFVAVGDLLVNSMIFETLEFKIRNLDLPIIYEGDGTSCNYIEYSKLVQKLSLQHLECVSFSIPDDVDEKYEKEYFMMNNFVLKKLLKRRSKEDETLDAALLDFSGLINQENFDLICNHFQGLISIIIDAQYQDLDLKNIFKMTNLTIFGYNKQKMSGRNMKTIVSFLAKNGHRMKGIQFHLSCDDQEIVDAITNYCPNLDFLYLNHYSSKDEKKISRENEEPKKVKKSLNFENVSFKLKKLRSLEISADFNYTFKTSDDRFMKHFRMI